MKPKELLIYDVSRFFVSQYAEEEEEFFELMDNAIKNNNKGNKSHNVLEFGIGELIIYLTPAIIAITTGVVNFIITQCKDVIWKDGIKEYLSDELKKTLEKWITGKSKEGLPEFSKEQLKEIKKVIHNSAKKNGLSEDVTEKIVNQIVVNLTLK
ncbi:MAG: hypothetical protein ACPG49_01285 [Chitinophagales bacterium]